MGFNFPCPCRRSGPGNGVLTNWTKGYACEGVLGKDVAVMLQEALNANGLSLIKVKYRNDDKNRPKDASFVTHLTAMSSTVDRSKHKKKFEKNYVKLQVEVLLNDTLATLLAGSYGPATASVLVGVMLGTATNAVFQQRLDQIPTTSYHANTLEVYKTYFENTMIIDTEWGAFGESTGDLDTLRTEFDEVNANGISIVDSAFNELGYNEISEFFEHSLEPIFFLTKMKLDNFFSLGPLNFAK